MLPIITREEFCKKVETSAASGKLTYLESVIKLQEDYGLDYSLVAKYLSQPIKEKLEKEGMDLNLLKKVKSTLPFA